MAKCKVCPRGCLCDRDADKNGLCGVGSGYKIAKAMLHLWEEPCVSGKNGAGAIFFSGCNLHCVYCQNKDISDGSVGIDATDDELSAQIFSLVEKGAECVELVTPTHYTLSLARLLSKIKHKLKIPIVWNSNAYESIDSLSCLDGLVDVYLPDFKYFSPELAKIYSNAQDYPKTAISAIKEMKRQVGSPEFNGRGIITRGMIVRHLVLPSHRKDSIEILRLLAEQVGTDGILLSLMSQYTPDFYTDGKFKNLQRRVTSFEYGSVSSEALSLGFDGYFQELSSANKKYTPQFK